MGYYFRKLPLVFASKGFEYLWIEKNQWVHWLPVALGSGIALYFLLSFEPSFLFISAIALLLFSFLYVVRKNFFLFPIALFVFFCAFGFLLIQTRTHLLNTPIILKKYKNVVFDGIIEEIESIPGKTRVLIKLIDNDSSQKIKHYKVRLRTHKLNGLKINDRIRGKCDLIPLQFPPTPWSFDYRRDAYFKKIVATGRILQINQVLPSTRSSISAYRYDFSQYLLSKLKKPAGSIASAITVGDKSAIPFSLRQAFSNAGIAHILAISGLHLSLLIGMIFWILKLLICFFFLPFANRFGSIKIAAFFSIFAALAYLLFSGSSYPTLRAFLMVSFVMGAILLNRAALSIRSVSLAATAILVIQPEALISASFQLSFAAVIPLIAFWEFFTPKIYGFKKTLFFILGPILTSLTASISTMPFSIWIFNKITLQSIVGNLLAIPIFTFLVMPLMLASVVFGHFFYTLWEKSLFLLIWIAEFVSELPGTQITLATPSSIWMNILIIFGGLWLCLWREKWRIFGVIPIFLGIMVYRPLAPPDYLIALNNFAWTEDGIFHTLNRRKGKYYLEDWKKIFNLELVKSEEPPIPIQIIDDYEDPIIDKEAKLIVSPYYVRRKIILGEKQILFDRDDFEKNGSHFIFNGFLIKNVRNYHGIRPWSPYR